MEVIIIANSGQENNNNKNTQQPFTLSSFLSCLSKAIRGLIIHSIQSTTDAEISI